MADEQVIETDEPEAEQTDETSEDGGQDFDAKIEALKADLEKKYKTEIAGLNRKVTELTQAKAEAENTGKSELEKVQEQISEITREREDLRVAALRERLAHAGGLDPEDVELLTGTDEDAIQKQVDRLKAKAEKAAAEALKKYDRDNGRTVTGPTKTDGLTYDKLQGMTSEQLRQIPPEVIAEITQKAAGN